MIDAAIGASLETQTLSIYDRQTFQSASAADWAPTMVHETAHQWFGDSVSPREWSDVWLNEGHATWYEFNYAAEHGELKKHTGVKSGKLDDLMRSYYGLGDFYRAKLGPVAKPRGGSFRQLFSAQQYYGGALTLYALREKVGDATFEKLERAWVSRYEGTSPSTASFIALASKVAGKNLGPFLRDWLYGTKTPAMPHHPDWKVKTVREVEGRP